MAAGKECSSCGAPNDVIFTNCMFCGTSLPEIDIDAISNDDLVMKASEWVGTSSEPFIKINGPNANEFTGKDIKTFQSGEIIGNAEKYLSLLKIRAKNNPTISVTVQSLADKLEQNISAAKKKKMNMFLYPIAGLIVLGVFGGIMASGESAGWDEEQEKLDGIELQIGEAIKDKNYDYALILVEKLNWSYELNIPSNQELANQYEDKRKGLKESINTMIERNK